MRAIAGSGEEPISVTMENRLLTVEVEFLRGRCRELESLAARAEADQRSRATKAGRNDARVTKLRQDVAELRQARSDLRWLLERLDRSPAGPLFRRFEGFRTLQERWLT